MRGMLPSGEAVTVLKRRRLRDEDVLRDRDVYFLIKVTQGSRKQDIAKEYRVSVRFLNRRLARIPDDIKKQVAKLVSEFAPDGDGFVPDAALDSLRANMKRGVDARRVG